MSRIIAGRRSGQRLQTPAHDRTRPTTDRVREAVFSALTTWSGGADRGPENALGGLSFADFFAGSGAVGLEAASRGAHRVLLVEADRRTAQVARGNAATARLSVTVRAERVERVVAEPPAEPFDVCWFDPPYDLGTEELDRVLAQTVAQRWVAEDGLLVVERATRSAAPSVPDFTETWARRYGETTVHYARRSTS